MFDLRGKLDAITDQFLKDTGLDQELIVKEFSIYERIGEKLKILMNETLKGKRVGIYGNGRMTKEFFYALEKVPENIACIIDQKVDEPLYWKLDDIPIIKPDLIEASSLDVIIIPSKVYEKDSMSVLEGGGVYFKGQVIGLHSWIESQGIEIEEEFDQYKGLWKYKRINAVYVRYIEKGNPKDLMSAIIGLLLIRDYCHGLELIEKYHGVSEKYRERTLKLGEQIENVFSEVRAEVLRRKTRHALIYVVDSLNWEAVEGMPKLKEIEKESFSLKELRNQYGSTRECVMTLMTGYRILEKELYKRIYFTEEDGELLPYLKKSDYQFHFLMDRSYAYAKLDQSVRECNNNIATEVYFSGICEMLLKKGNTFTYMHGFAEIHPPFCNPLFEKGVHKYPFTCSFDEFMEQYESSQKYVDELLWFYYKIFKCDSVTQIIMGDHGIDLNVFRNPKEYKVEIYRWEKKLLSPACIISDSSLGVGSNCNLIANYSLAKLFKEILERTLTKEELERYFDKKIKISILPVYSPELLNQLLIKKQVKRALGVVGVLDDQDMFFYLENGEEKLFICDEEVDLNRDEYSDKIREYREALAFDIEESKNILELKRYAYHNEWLHQYS